MKKIKMLFSIMALMCIFTANVIAAPTPQKIAVVDIQKVVLASTQVKALKKSRDAKSKELITFIKNAQADINKQTDATKKKALAEKYEKQIKAKREANAKEYATKLKAADDSITQQIGMKAKELGYTMVIPKSAVIYGGDDITEVVLKVIK